MLSRVSALSKFSSFIRQISLTTNLNLANPVQIKNELPEDKPKNQNFNNNQNLNRKQFKNQKNSNNQNEYKKNPKQFKPAYNQQHQQFNPKEKTNQGESSGLKMKNLYKMPATENLPTEKSSQLNPKENFNQIVENLNKNLKNIQNLYQPCQQLCDLYEQDPKIAESFCSDPLKASVINALLTYMEKMTPKEFFVSVQFILRFDPSKFDRLKSFLSTNLPSLEIGQVLKLVLIMRNPNLFSFQTLDIVRAYTNTVRERLDELDNLQNLKLAMKFFTNEPSIIKKLDNKLLQLSNKLTSLDWVDLLNSKSIYRQRNVSILESCAYNLIKKKDDKALNVESIQKCLLSCGILNYNDDQFYKFLLDSLNEELKKNESNSNWFKQNEKNISSIISSIGIIQLRDEKLLNTLCSAMKNYSDKPKLISSFIMSCASLNYEPRKEDLKTLASKVDLKDFNLTDKREKLNFLTYVWSLCSLNQPNKQLVSKVLAKDFWEPLFNDKESKELKSILSKVLNINLYSMLSMENYEGPNLPEDFNMGDYAQHLIPKQNNSTDIFLSALSSYRSIDKYAKLNLLTPFGILIDALMIVDKNGSPCQLAKFFNQNSALETSQNELKVALKLLGYKDQTLISKNVNGIVAFQIKLLKELGYHTIIITQEELKTTSLINRVNLIQNKIKELANKKF